MPGEPAAISSGHADDEELLGEERVKVVGSDDVQVDGELGIGPGPELGGVQVRVTGVLGTGAKPCDNCKERMLRSLCEPRRIYRREKLALALH